MDLFMCSSIKRILLMPVFVAILLQGCSSMNVSDRRTTQSQIEDSAIELKAVSRLRDRFGSDKAISTSVVSFNRTALITGFAPDAATKLDIGMTVARIENVRQVVNEVQLTRPVSTNSYTQDVYLTTRVKLTLLDHRSINADAIKVVVVSSTVYLMGLVTEKEASEAASLTSRVPGVRRVVRAFEIISESQLAQITFSSSAGTPEVRQKADGNLSDSSQHKRRPSRIGSSPREELLITCETNRDCPSGTSCRSKSGGGNECRDDVYTGRTSTPPVAQAPRQEEPPRSTLSLSASASQPDPNGVVTLTITTNSDTASLKVNGDEAGGRADGRYAVKRFAQVGENRFEIVATDRFGNTQRQTVSVNREFVQTAPIIPPLNPLAVRAVKQRDTVAIVIGIEKYQSVPTADFANRDASIFVDYAMRALGIPRENIRLLLDEKAGAAEILLTFKNWLPTRIKRGSTEVYVFYSGHGLPSEDGRSLFFLPHEANRDLLERTAISQNELVAAIQKSSPKSVTMFIDSCYSGQSRTGETLLASARPISIVAKETSSFPSNFTVISASAPDQISSSSPELKHGIFSYYLMRGMEGEADSNKDGQITVAEMQTYLSAQVTRQAMSMNRTQQPQVVGDTSRVLVGR
jgi:osmotically-inducible protein OsmY